MSISSQFLLAAGHAKAAQEIYEEAKDNLGVAVTKLIAAISVELQSGNIDEDDRASFITAADHFRGLLNLIRQEGDKPEIKPIS